MGIQVSICLPAIERFFPGAMVTAKVARNTSGTAAKERKKSAAGKRSARPVHKLRIQHVSLASVARVCTIFYTGLVAAGLVATIVAWGVLGSMGFISKANHLIDQLVGSTNYQLGLTQVLVIQLGLGIAWVVVMTVLTYLAAAIYNLASEMGNGISIGVVDDSK